MLELCELPISALDDLAQPGDLLLYRDRSLQERIISRAGRSLYGHAGMLCRDGRRWAVLEMVEFYGGRRRYLADALRDDPGDWDLFAANAGNRWQWDRRLAVLAMWRFVNRPYGWRHILRVALLHLPLIRALVPAVTDDADADRHSPFCSEAVSIATRKAGIDPVPRLPDSLTEPGDLARSLFYDYTCTLAKSSGLRAEG